MHNDVVVVVVVLPMIVGNAVVGSSMIDRIRVVVDVVVKVVAVNVRVWAALVLVSVRS
jgi:hypothetical protein